MQRSTTTTFVSLLVCCLIIGLATAQTEEEFNTPKETSITQKLGEVQSLMFNTLRGSDGLIGGSVVTYANSEGLLSEESQTFGVGGTNKKKPMTLDRCLNLNEASELIFVFAFLRAFDNENLEAEISTAHSPGGVVLLNPTSGGKLRYSHLMDHLSTLNDLGFEDARVINTDNTVATLKDYVEGYFLDAGGRLKPSIFASLDGTTTPGDLSSYRHARINTALLGYITEKIVTAPGEGFGYSSLQHYIYQQVLAPLGMSSTFFLRREEGRAPGTYIETGSNVATSFYDGCIVDRLSNNYHIHPAYPSDYMTYTTATDFARLVYGLMMDDRYTAMTSHMRTRKGLTVTPPVEAQVAQGYGLMYFNGLGVCGPALNSRIISGCVLNNTEVIGYVSQRGHSSVSFLCTESSKYGRLCVISTLLYEGSNTASRSPSHAFQIAAGTFEELTGTIEVSTEAPKASLRDDDEERVFGVYIFIGVYLSILFVLFGTSAIQYFLNPAALAASTDTGAAAGMGPDAADPGKTEPSILPETD